MKPISNLNSILQDGYSLQYEWRNYGRQNVTISTHQIGELILTSGRIIPCDPLLVPDSRYHLKKTVRPGRYPVIVSLADFHPVGDSRFACAMLQMSDEATVKWEVALINEPDSDQTGDRTNYGVDAGTGCFVDWDVAELIANLVSLEISYPEKDEFEMFCDRVIAEMEKNSFGNHSLTAGWADMKVSDDSEGNIIAFSSGWGDGGYASFWGYDASGNLTSLVTDFALFPSGDAA
ncbi:MAG TPA: DUF4241 domain-containing protein [Pyrinomonadaceae bacterium]|nr:DUF4241 domain-containing protein [Pyrinomonadaceae bacterium]